MRGVVVGLMLVALVALPAGGVPAPMPRAASGDLAKLQGHWELTSKDGQALELMDDEPPPRQMRMRIERSHARVVSQFGRRREEADVTLTVALAATATRPGRLTLTASGGRLICQCLYAITDDGALKILAPGTRSPLTTFPGGAALSLNFRRTVP